MCSVHENYDDLFSLDNIFEAWKIYRRGKTRMRDAMNFEMHLEDNLFGLYEDLRAMTYRHGEYRHFQIFDNKKRDICMSPVRDRVVHQIVYDHLLSLYGREFIADSYASRNGKGQYKAVKAFQYFLKLSDSSCAPCFVLKCDVRKYFDSIDQNTLFCMIRKKVACEKILAIIKEIIFSYDLSATGKGIPLGNITSQVFANIYLNVLDTYVKKELRCRFYVRYNDDFVILSESRENLEKIRNAVIIFAKKNLLLDIPLQKTCIRKADWGIDFLGFTVLPKALLLRNKTKNKMYANIDRQNIHSYFSILKRCRSHNLKEKILAMEKLNKI